jgi:iduronate 2-sulfatase
MGNIGGDTMYLTKRIAAAFAAAVILFSSLPAGAAAENASDTEIRNVLFIVSDDLKASVLGCYGDKVCKTPNIDKLASEGMVFNRAYCQAMWCQPSRRSFMYSRYQDAAGISVGEHFKNNGWYSARVSKIFHMGIPDCIISGSNGEDVPESWTERFNCKGKEAHTPGDYACLNLNIFTTELEGRESAKMRNRMWVSVSYKGDGSDQPDYKAADKTIELLRNHKDKPFFIATGLVRPHYPSVAPEQYFEPYPWETIELPEVPENDLDDIPTQGRARVRNDNNDIGKYPDNQKRMWTAYYATVTFMDDQVGRIIDELDRLGLRESTVIVFFSDHGYHLGEHTFWKKQNLHEEVSRVPLIVSVPGMKPGRTDAITELVDIYPSLAELVGLPIPEEVQGMSFVPVLKDPAAEVKTGAMSIRKGIALRTKKFAYMRYDGGRMPEELYDMKKDPKQFTNQASNPEYSTVLKQLQSQLDARIKEVGILSDQEAKEKRQKAQKEKAKQQKEKKQKGKKPKKTKQD